MYWNTETRDRPHATRRGFTLLELIVVVAIIATLAAMAAPQVFRNVGDAKIAAAKAEIETLALALDAYRMHNDGYPTTEQGLGALSARPAHGEPPADWRGPYLRRPATKDPWGRPYLYRSPGDANPESYDLLSYGKDGKPGGRGEDADVMSWGDPAGNAR